MKIENLFNYGANRENFDNLFLGDEDLYIHCIEILIQEDKPGKMALAVEAKSYKEAFELCHSVKGMIGNLGLDKLFETIKPLLEDLRNSKFENVNALKDTFMKEYNLFLEACK